MEPQPVFVEAGRLESPLPLEDLIRISLAASGVAEKDLLPLTRQYTQAVAQAPGLSGSSYEKGEQLLAWMHKEYLSAYREPQTKMDILFKNGTYNCVSSAVLYLFLLRQGGLEGGNIQTVDHVFSTLITPQGVVDVETTTPYGFDPGTNKNAAQAFSKQTGFVYVPPRNYRDRLSISDKELVALILQNRVVLLQKQNRWADALGLSWDHWALVKNQRSYNFLLGGIHNWVTSLGRRREYRAGLLFLDEVARILEDPEGMGDSAKIMLHNATTQALQKGDIPQALELLQTPVFTRLVPPSLVEELLLNTRQKELEIQVKAGPFAPAAAALAQAREAGMVTPARWEEYLLFLWSREADRLAREEGPGTALRFLQQAPSSVPSSFNRMLDVYKNNTMAFYHNRFVSHFRASRWEKALAALEEGLSYLPQNPQLLDDKKKLQEARL